MPPPIEQLSPELFARVVEFLPDVQDVANIASVNRWARNMFLGSQAVIVRQVLINQLSDVGLAMCLARHAAFVAWWKHPKYKDVAIDCQNAYLGEVEKFCDTYFSKDAKLLIEPKKQSLKIAFRMVKFDECASRLADGIVNFPGKPYFTTSPSKSEMARLKRSIYILDIESQLFHTTQYPPDEDWAFDTFWSCFAPWESTQMKALESALRMLLLKASSRAPDIKDLKLLSFRDHHCAMLVLLMGVEALSPIIHKAEFPDNWDKVLKAARSFGSNTPSNWAFPRSSPRTSLNQDIFQWFNPPEDWASRHAPYSARIQDLDIDKYDGDAYDDTGPRDAWLWMLYQLVEARKDPTLDPGDVAMDRTLHYFDLPFRDDVEIDYPLNTLEPRPNQTYPTFGQWPDRKTIESCAKGFATHPDETIEMLRPHVLNFAPEED